MREHNYQEGHCNKLRSLLRVDDDGTEFVEWIKVEKNRAKKLLQQTRNRKRSKTASELSGVDDSEGHIVNNGDQSHSSA